MFVNIVFILIYYVFTLNRRLIHFKKSVLFSFEFLFKSDIKCQKKIETKKNIHYNYYKMYECINKYIQDKGIILND